MTEQTEQAGVPRPEAQARKPVVLYIDDDAGMQALQRRTLTLLGVQFDIATDGQDAIRKFTDPRANYSVVLTDFDMPGMNGVDLAQKIKELNPSTIIGLLSGRKYAEGEIEELHQKGISYYLQKPFTLQDLEKTLQEITEELNAQTPRVA